MRTWIVALAIIAPLAALDAQTVAVGDRIRLTVPESQPQQEAPGSRRLVLRGEVTRVTRDSTLIDSIYIRPAPATSELGIPVSAIKSLQRSRGVSRAESAVRMAFVLAVTTALFAPGLYDSEDDGRSWEEQALFGAALGAGTGIVVGVIFPTEGWQRLKNWNR
jgi:hypothetical protein